MKRTRRITRNDVAEAAGVSTFTVSQALSGKAGVAAKTRAHVEAVAARLGYAINPAASLLARQRSRHRADRQLAVGLLGPWHYDDPAFLSLCEDFGLQGYCFRPHDFPSPEKASRELWHRGISGLVLCPPLWSEEGCGRFDWSRFSLVKSTRAMPDVPCHLVRLSPFDYMTATLQQVVDRGYRRLAVVLIQSESKTDDDARYGALLNFRERKMPSGVTCEWRQAETGGSTELDSATIAWIRKQRPDVIVAYHWSMIYSLQNAGFRIPGEVALAAVLSQAKDVAGTPRVSGCESEDPELMRRLLITLQELIGRGERGLSRLPMEQVMEPVWVEGETLPERM